LIQSPTVAITGSRVRLSLSPRLRYTEDASTVEEQKCSTNPGYHTDGDTAATPENTEVSQEAHSENNPASEYPPRK
jgi:hypothetical protein